MTVYRDSGEATRLASGERPEDPVVVARNVPAKIAILAGRELERARQLVANVTHEVTLRYRSDVTHRCWLLWGGRRLDIEAAVPDPRQRWLVCSCYGEGVTDAV